MLAAAIVSSIAGVTATVRSAFRRLDARRRESGAAYAALAAARLLAERLEYRLEERLLAIEGRRGTLGPAHRRHRANSVDSNREVWTGWDWSAEGEEWTESPAWKAALRDEVLLARMPRGDVLEIGPGAGRWSETLRQHSERLVLVDVTKRTLELCRERLGPSDDVRYVLGGGSDLPGVADASIDGVWSFDVFVHIAPVDVAAYLSEIRRVLRPGGIAVIHHSGRRDRRGWRSPMSGPLFAALARERGLLVEEQFDSWSGGRYDVHPFDDVITVLRAAADG